MCSVSEDAFCFEFSLGDSRIDRQSVYISVYDQLIILYYLYCKG